MGGDTIPVSWAVTTGDVSDRTRGRSSENGANLVSKESANTTACKGSSLSSSAPFDFCAFEPFLDLGAMLSLVLVYGSTGVRRKDVWSQMAFTKKCR